MKRNKDDAKEEPVADPVGPSTSNGTDATAPAAGTSSSASAAAAAAAASVRTTGRVKKPKQVYDPSDNYVSRASNRSSIGSSGSTTTVSVGVASNEDSPPANVSSATEANDSLESKSENQSPSTSEKQQQQPPQAPQLQQNGKFDTCQKCNKSEPKRGSGHKSNFLTCKTCMQKWHFPCLAVNFENLVLARKKYKCEKCRYCNVCNIRGRNLPICTMCAEAYHPHCNNKALKPSTKAIDIDPKWKCFRCEEITVINNNNNNSTINNASSSGGEQPSPLAKKSNVGRKKRILSDPTGQKKPAKLERLERLENPPVTAKRDAKDLDKEDYSQEKRKKLEEPGQSKESPMNSSFSGPSTSTSTPAEITDSVTENIKSNPVSKWTVDQVVCFVRKRYPVEAHVFRDQDIDGASLLLLTRHDVMTRFGLKVGPALHIYELVLSLQSQSNDVAVAWVE
ncbi:hypothetical protein KR038_002605 [Drosophila bunnanda]|nr:hypothetical protein KR038_002605 [Drosophila bunnanda]